MAARIKMDANLESKFLKDPGTAWLLREVAEKAKGKVKLPKRSADEQLALSVRAGIGPRHAFAQVIMTGHEAVIVEFGTRYRKAQSPLRTAVYSMKGVKAGGR